LLVTKGIHIQTPSIDGMDFDKGDTEVWIYKRKIYENRLKMPKEDLKNVKILKTIVGGKVVYEKK
jgi:hypothetical protein